jgi:hypothetical protein
MEMSGRLSNEDRRPPRNEQRKVWSDGEEDGAVSADSVVVLCGMFWSDAVGLG